MPYFVTWIRDGQIGRFAYAPSDLDAALDFACTAFRMECSDVWVIDEQGQKVADRRAVGPHADRTGGLIRTITEKRAHRTPHEPTGWERVDRNVTAVRKALAEADTEEKCQAVALLCRETVISLAQAVFDSKQHPILDGTSPSPTDAKRMLEAYIAVAFAGGEHEHFRKQARSAYDLAAHLQHKRTATFRQAAASRTPSVLPPPRAPPKNTSGALQSTRAFCGPD